LHKEIIDQLTDAAFDKVYLCGEYFSEASVKFMAFPTTEELIKELTDHPLKGYHVLIKGSRSMKLENTIPLL